MSWVDIVQGELGKCTDCGLCLSSCPTFTLDRAEGESPRGRVHLLRATLDDGFSDPFAADHLASCLECGACHAPCPTGVRVGVARRTHRAATEPLDQRGFETRVSELAELIAVDPGAELTIQSVRELLAAPAERARPEPDFHSVGQLALFGPMLRQVRPNLVKQLGSRLSAMMLGRSLASSLERASGLLRDVGLVADHRKAIADVEEIIAARGYPQVTVVVFDHLLLRLRDEPLPGCLRIVPAHQILQGPIASDAEHLVWDHAINGGVPPPNLPADTTRLPPQHVPASAPVLLSAPALRMIQTLNSAKGAWLAGRNLITTDSRALVRFPGSRHLAELLPRTR